MASLVSPTTYGAPFPIAPVAPNFVFCYEAYGTNLRREDALRAGGRLPEGTVPVTYSVGIPDLDGPAANVSASEEGYQLPFLIFYGSVGLSVDVSGPVNIDSINLVPNDIRGMAAYVAIQCLGRHGVGGFITNKIQGLVDFVTDPASDIDQREYPDSTAFVTLAITNYEQSHTFPGDYDPQMAGFLRNVENAAVTSTPPRYRDRIMQRVLKFTIALTRMRRLETEVTWYGAWLGQKNKAANATVQLNHTTTEGLATTHRRRRIRGLWR